MYVYISKEFEIFVKKIIRDDLQLLLEKLHDKFEVFIKRLHVE